MFFQKKSLISAKVVKVLWYALWLGNNNTKIQVELIKYLCDDITITTIMIDTK